MGPIVAIDATWLIRRQFHALNMGIVSGSQETGDLVQDPLIIVKSFLTCVQKIIRDYKYERKIVALWDRGTWRYRPKDEFTGYKASREYDTRWDACWAATNIAIELTRRLGMYSIQVPGCEADDIGMYYSHNNEDCVLYCIDSDWTQSLRPTTIIDKAGKSVVTYEETFDGNPLSEPIDWAIMKAIDGGHDDLEKVSTDLSYEELFARFKNKTLDKDLLDKIEYNFRLSRLDQVLGDKDVHKIIKQQEEMTHAGLNDMSLTITLATHLNEYPPYFLGVFGKYNRVFNS